MLAALVLVLTIASPQAPKSVWVELNLKRTGNNGYEEYLDAVDLYRASGASSIVNDYFSPDKTLPSKLQLARIIEKKIDSTIMKMEQGNLKPVHEILSET